MSKRPSDPKPQKMVEWLAPSVLLKSGQEVVLSSLFANFADKRETMGGLPKETFTYDVAPGEEFWFDYASDVGDGFDSTHMIARLLAEPSLTLREPGEAEHVTRRGPLLVLGGDQVYPSAKWETYEERFSLPYKQAFPAPPLPERDPPRDFTSEELAEPPTAPAEPHLFAIPGNHDWYDGLTSFTRLFCQQGRIGGWTTRQHRSYFAIDLPHNWWLWGIDIQFDAYVDGPQLAYFAEVAKRMPTGARVILATAKPSWVKVENLDEPPQSWKSLAWFEEEIICKNNGRLALTITGDLHHYSRYDLNDPDPAKTVGGKITAGGGGAYLSPTHWLPGSLALPDVRRPPEPKASESKRWQQWQLRKAYPTAEQSKGLVTGIIEHVFPWKTWKLGFVLFAVYAVVALLLAAGVKDRDGDFGPSVGDDVSWLDALGDSMTSWFAVLGFGVLVGMWKWARAGEAPGPLGALHALAHLVVATAATLAVLFWAPWDHGFTLGYFTAVVVGLVGAIVGRGILTVYLAGVHGLGLAFDRPKWHANEVFAGQGIADYKNFLRFHIDANGKLTVFAIGVDSPPKFVLQPEGKPKVKRSRRESVDLVPGEYAHVIEKLTVESPETAWERDRARSKSVPPS